MQRLLDRLTYSNVVSSLCLVLVLGGGTAFAAGKLGKNSVGTRQLQSEAVTGAKIKDGVVTGDKVEDGSLTGADIKASSLGTVPTADLARTATNAASAQTATSAKTAESAGTAKTADSAKTAQSAVTAERATVANTATSAQTAGSAISADTATSAGSAAKATVAEALTGHTAFSVFTEGERQIASAYPLNITLRCTANGSDRTASLIVESVEGATVLTAGEAFQTIEGGNPVAEVLTVEGKGGAKAAKASGDITIVAPNESALALEAPTVATNLDPNHSGQCYFSGVLERPKALPAQ